MKCKFHKTHVYVCHLLYIYPLVASNIFNSLPAFIFNYISTSVS